MSGQSVAYSDLLEIAKRNVDFKKLWSASNLRPKKRELHDSQFAKKENVQ